MTVASAVSYGSSALSSAVSACSTYATSVGSTMLADPLAAAAWTVGAGTFAVAAWYTSARLSDLMANSETESGLQKWTEEVSSAYYTKKDHREAFDYLTGIASDLLSAKPTFKNQARVVALDNYVVNDGFQEDGGLSDMLRYRISSDPAGRRAWSQELHQLEVAKCSEAGRWASSIYPHCETRRKWEQRQAREVLS